MFEGLGRHTVASRPAVGGWHDSARLLAEVRPDLGGATSAPIVDCPHP
jgi:hypothetical protein